MICVNPVNTHTHTAFDWQLHAYVSTDFMALYKCYYYYYYTTLSSINQSIVDLYSIYSNALVR